MKFMLQCIWVCCSMNSIEFSCSWETDCRQSLFFYHKKIIPHFRIKCQNISKIFIPRKKSNSWHNYANEWDFFSWTGNTEQHGGGRSVSPMLFFIPWIFYPRFCIQRRRHVETVFRHDVIKILSSPQVFNQTEKNVKCHNFPTPKRQPFVKKNIWCAFTHISPRRAMRFRRQRKKPLSGTPAA